MGIIIHVWRKLKIKFELQFEMGRKNKPPKAAHAHQPPVAAKQYATQNDNQIKQKNQSDQNTQLQQLRNFQGNALDQNLQMNMQRNSSYTDISHASQSSLGSQASFNGRQTDEEEFKLIRQIQQHALEFNNKQRIQDLNLLDVLNSFDEVMKSSNISKERSQKLYRKLLQVQREHQENQRPGQENQPHRENSQYSTLNEDLQFDFLGSFGNNNEMKRQRSQSQMKSIADSNFMKQSDSRNKSSHIEPPSVMNSQFQSLAIFNQAPSLNNPSKDNYHSNNSNDAYKTSLMDSNLHKMFNHHQNQSQDSFHSASNALGSHLSSSRFQDNLHLHSASNPSLIQNSIKLPKLSFNDLIQAQNFDSFKRLSDQQMLNTSLSKDDSTENLSQMQYNLVSQENLLASQEKPLGQIQTRYDPYDVTSKLDSTLAHRINNEDEELKSQEISVFRTTSKMQRQHSEYIPKIGSISCNPFNQTQGSSLMKYSNNQTYIEDDHHLQSNSNIKVEDENLLVRLPKLKLITESELQSIDNQIFKIESRINEKDKNEMQRNSLSGSNQYKREKSADSIPKLNIPTQCQITPQTKNSTHIKVPHIQKHQVVGEHQTISSKGSKKENVIDSEIKLALAFQTKKLLLKTWKSWMIVKMHRIHQAHLQRLARSHLKMKVKQRFYQHWKLYVKLILPQERLHRKAHQYHSMKLKLKAFHLLKEKTRKRRELQAKLISTKLVLRSCKIRKAFELLKQSVELSQAERIKKLQSNQVYFNQLRLKALRALQIRSNIALRNRQIQMRSVLYYQQSLAKKALVVLYHNLQVRTQENHRLSSARQYFTDHHSNLMQNKSFQILKQFAKHSRQNKLAMNQNRYWILHKFFKTLKYNCYLRRGAKNQQDFLKRFRNRALLLKAIKSFAIHTFESKDRQYLISNYLVRVRVRKVFRALYRHKVEHYVHRAAHQGMFIECARTMLEKSFSKVMQSVWMEFPKQKQVKNAINSKNNLMLNYIGLSKNHRYRCFFHQANHNLRNYHLQKIFNRMKQYSSAIKLFKEKIAHKFQKKVFLKLKKYLRRRSIINSIIKSKSTKKDLLLVFQVFKAFKQLTKSKSKGTKAFFKTLINRKRRILSQHLKRWLTKYNSQQRVSYNEEVASKIFRHRNLSKFLALWLKQLHQKLKGDYLETLSQKFQKHQVRSRFLKKWMEELQKIRYLKDQEDQIYTHQTNLLQYQCFQFLKSYAQKKVEGRLRIQVADQEYRYWLGKRCVQQWQQGLYILRSQSQLHGLLAQERNQRVLVQVFERIKLFKQFKIERKINDEALARAILSIRKQTVLNKWAAEFKKGLGARFMNKVLTQVVKRSFVKNLRRLVAYQESVVEVMREKRSSYCLFQQFKALLRNQIKQKYLQKAREFQYTKNKLFSIKQSYNLWRNTYEKRRKVYGLYAITVIQLKNQFLNQFVNAWKYFIQRRKQKKFCLRNQRLSMKAKIFNQLRLKSMKSQHILNCYTFIKSKMLKENKQKNFRKWKQLFLTERWLQARYLQSQLKKKATILHALKEFKHRQITLKEEVAQRKQYLDTKYQAIYFTKLKNIISSRIKLKHKLQLGSNFNAQYMFRLAFQTWISFYSSNKQMIQKQVKIKRKAQKSLKAKHLQVWLKKSEKALNRLRSLKKLVKMRNRKETMQRFDTWVTQTNYLISLEQKSAQLAKVRNLRDKSSALLQLQQFAEKRALYKFRSLDIIQYFRKKLLIKGAEGLKRFVEHRRQQAQNKDHSFLQYIKWLKLSAFSRLRHISTQQSMIKQSTSLFRHSQKLIFCRGAIQKMKMHAIEKHSYLTKMYYSTNFSNQSTTKKMFEALLSNVSTQRMKRQIKSKAYQHCSFRLQLLVFSKWMKETKEHQLKSKRRVILSHVISSMDQEIFARHVLKIFRVNALISKEERIQNRQKLRLSKLKRIFSAFRSKFSAKSNLRYLSSQLQKRISLKIKQRQYKMWREAYFGQKLVYDFRDQRSSIMKAKVFQAFQIRMTIMKQAYEVEIVKMRDLKTKVLMALYQNSKVKRLSKQKVNDAELSDNFRLCAKVINGFKKVKEQNIKIGKGLQNHERVLKQTVLIALLQHNQQQQNLKLSIKTLQTKQLKQLFSQWTSKFSDRLDFKSRIVRLLNKFEHLDKQSCFNQWKRGAFFMKTCELIYVHRFQEEEQSLLKNCFREWKRYQLHQLHKVEQHHLLKENHLVHTQRHYFKQWLGKDIVKGILFQIKMKRLLLPRYESTLEQVFNYAIRDQELNHRVQKFENRMVQQAQQKYFYEWLIRFQQNAQISILKNKRAQRLKRRALLSFEQNRLSKIQEKYQMLRVIQFYSQRRPELLLAFSKTFLILNNQHASTLEYYDDDQRRARICSTALAKYIFEKWKNIKDVIQVENQLNNRADEYYVYSLARRHLQAFRKAVNLIGQKRSLMLSCQEFYCVNLMKGAMRGLKINTQCNAKSCHLRQCQFQILKAKKQTLFEKCFYSWREAFASKQNHREIESAFLSRRELLILRSAIYTFRNYAVKNKSEKRKYDQAISAISSIRQLNLKVKAMGVFKSHAAMSKVKTQKLKEINEAALNHYYAKIITKYFKMLKDQTLELKLKNKHSKMFSIFVAWKFFVRENKLLHKYLSECDYKGNQSKSKNGKSNSQGPNKNLLRGKHAISQQKENLESLNESDFNMKQHRFERFSREPLLREQSDFEMKVVHTQPQPEFNSISSVGLYKQDENERLALIERSDSLFNQLSQGTSQSRTRQPLLAQINSKLFTPTLGSNINQGLNTGLEKPSGANIDRAKYNSNNPILGIANGLFNNKVHRVNLSSLASEGNYMQSRVQRGREGSQDGELRTLGDGLLSSIGAGSGYNYNYGGSASRSLSRDHKYY